MGRISLLCLPVGPVCACMWSDARTLDGCAACWLKNQAEFFAKQGKWEEARASLAAAIDKDPSNEAYGPLWAFSDVRRLF